jgi:hypothetical protein
MKRLRVLSILGSLLAAGSLDLRPNEISFGAEASAHHIGAYRRGCAASRLEVGCKPGALRHVRIFLGCISEMCHAWHHDHAAHDAEHAKWAREESCRQNTARTRAQAPGHVASAKAHLARTKEFEAAARLADKATADNMARLAGDAAVATAGEQNKLYALVHTPCSAAEASAGHREAQAMAAQALGASFRASFIARAFKLADALAGAFDKYVEGLRNAALDFLGHVRTVNDRAPKALEAVGFDGPAKDRFSKAVSVVRHRAGQSFRLLRVVRALIRAALHPVDASGVDHLDKVMTPQQDDRIRKLLAAPTDEAEIDKELDNLSLKELGVKGEGGDKPEEDPKNLETPFDKSKEALGRFVREGNRLLSAAGGLALGTHSKHLEQANLAFKGAALEMRAGLKEIILAITALQKSQSGR